MRYVYKASDLKPGEGMLTADIPETAAMPAWLHRLARDWADDFASANPGDRAVMLTVNLTVSVLYVPASVALPAAETKKKGRK